MNRSYFIQTIDPVLFHVGPIMVRWYGLAYVAGFVVGLQLMKWVAKRDRLLPLQFDFESLVFHVAIGVIAGGRLGEVIFYSPGYYFSHPLEILALWKGGMSSHGGMIGVLISILVFCRKTSTNVIVLLDLVCIAATPGLFFGRLANFINSEMVGYVTTVPWAVIFPAYDSQPRHPVQLYQAFTEGPLILILLLALPYPRIGIGMRISVFMILYAVMRIFTEYFRQVDTSYLGLTFGMTNGQLLSLALGAVGLMCSYFSIKHAPRD